MVFAARPTSSQYYFGTRVDVRTSKWVAVSAIRTLLLECFRFNSSRWGEIDLRSIYVVSLSVLDSLVPNSLDDLISIKHLVSQRIASGLLGIFGSTLSAFVLDVQELDGTWRCKGENMEEWAPTSLDSFPMEI